MSGRSVLAAAGIRAPRAEREAAYAVMSALLRYPDDGLVRDVPLLATAIAGVPGAIADPLRRMIGRIASTPLLELQAAYVATFDLRRKCCLHLSYYLSGDTRRRGGALWRFQDGCRRAGFRVVGGELPDFLPVLLELAASGGEAIAVQLIQEHREGITMLGAALRNLRSPYADVLEALEALLPPARQDATANAVRLAREGPPSELVGLDSASALGAYQLGGACTPGSEGR